MRICLLVYWNIPIRATKYICYTCCYRFNLLILQFSYIRPHPNHKFPTIIRDSEISIPISVVLISISRFVSISSYHLLSDSQCLCIFRWWQISLRNSADSRYPGESLDTYEDFIYDELLQRNFMDITKKKLICFNA